MITVSKLPPKEGYIEVEVNGTRIYEPTPETAEKLKLENENKTLRAQLDLQSQQLTFLEDCVLEMGDVVYAE